MGDGRLLVSDGGSRFVLNVMHAELDTVLVRFARRGRGPGELGGAYSQLAVLPQNVVRVLDRMNRKELWFSADGDLLDERTIRDLGVRLGTMAYLGNEIVGERWTFSSRSEVAIDLMKLDSLGTTARVVELPRHPENWKPGEIQVGRPLWAVVGDNIVTGRSDLAEFAVYDALGQLVRTIRLDLSTREITADEVRVEQTLHPGLAYVFTPGKIAITNALYPFGRDAFAMLQSGLWRAAEDEVWQGITWRVIGLDGTYRGVLEIPPDFVPTWTDGREMWGVGATPVGIPLIMQLHLRPPTDCQ